MTGDERFAEWLRWLEVLRRDVVAMHHERELFTELRDAIQAKRPGTGTWLAHYARLYWQTQVMAIRRVVRGKDPAISFTRLVRDLAANCEFLTEERHLALYNPEFEMMCRVASEEYERRWGDGTGKASQEKLLVGLDEVMRDLNRIFDRADRAVAHLDERGPTGGLTFGEIDDAIDRVGDAFNDLNLLLTASTWVWAPAIQNDWKEPFREPLFDPPLWSSEPSPPDSSVSE